MNRLEKMSGVKVSPFMQRLMLLAALSQSQACLFLHTAYPEFEKAPCNEKEVEPYGTEEDGTEYCRADDSCLPSEETNFNDYKVCTGSSPDMGVDAGMDMAPDMPADMGMDAGIDMTPDMPIDMGMDAGMDMTPDLPADMDMGMDAGMDMTPDMEIDMFMPIVCTDEMTSKTQLINDQINKALNPPSTDSYVSPDVRVVYQDANGGNVREDFMIEGANRYKLATDRTQLRFNNADFITVITVNQPDMSDVAIELNEGFVINRAMPGVIEIENYGALDLSIVNSGTKSIPSSMTYNGSTVIEFPAAGVCVVDGVEYCESLCNSLTNQYNLLTNE